MARHPFDPVSFVLGGVAIASGAVVLADRSLTDDARVLLPAGLIALGIALFAKVVRGDDRPATAGPSPAPGPVPPIVDLSGTGPTPTDDDALTLDLPNRGTRPTEHHPTPDHPGGLLSPTDDDPCPEDTPRRATGATTDVSPLPDPGLTEGATDAPEGDGAAPEAARGTESVEGESPGSP